MTAPVSIRDVAGHARVSVGTVSNVLNHPEIVAPATRRRVRASIQALGFVRNESARQLRAGRSRMIGLMVPDVSNPFYTDVARGVEDEASAAGVAVILCNSDDQLPRQARYLDLLEEQRVQGVLLTPCPVPMTGWPGCAAAATPVVLVDCRPSATGQCAVAVDDVRGGEVAVSHLLAAGHRRIAFVGGPPGVRQVADRLEGARRALRRPGADAGDLLLIETAALSLAAGQQAGAQLAAMAAGRRPTAAFCVNDLVALGAAQQLARHQVRIPEDVALLGYDDIEFAATAAVPLSSVASPATSSGERPRSFSWRKRPPETVTSTTGISTTGTSIAR